LLLIAASCAQHSRDEGEQTRTQAIGAYAAPKQSSKANDAGAGDSVGRDAPSDRPRDVASVADGRDADACIVSPRVSAATFAIYARRQLTLGPSASVEDGDVGVRDRSNDDHDAFPVVLFPHASVDDGNTAFASSLLLKVDSAVGTAATDRLVNRGGRYRALQPFPEMPALPGPSPAEPGRDDLVVAPHKRRALSGDTRLYDVRVGAGATLRLGAGTYQFANLIVDAKAAIEITGPVEIRVRGRVSLGEGAFVGPASGVVMTAADLTLSALGEDADPPG
jgi:hypothetical protein